MKSLFRYRKTALIISVALFVVFFFHLVGSYIYSGGKFVGLPGGSVSVGAVSENIPDPMNPFSYGSDHLGDLMFNMMFRSLVSYNSATGIFEGDLASCDLSDLKKIVCILRDDAIWSDGTPITADDISATFSALGQQVGAKNLRSAFKNISVTNKDKEIVLSSPVQNNRIVEAISYPILRTDMIDQIKNKRLKKENYITSGPFIFDESVPDEQYGFHKISLKKNPNYSQSVWLDRFNFKIFPDAASLERGIETTHIVLLPPNREAMKTPTIFRPEHYSQYEFFGIFFNTDTLDKSIRNILHKHLAKTFQENPLSTAGQIPVESIFEDDPRLIFSGSLTNFADFMKEKGYQKKQDLLAHLSQKPAEKITPTIPDARYFANGNGKSILFSDDPKGEITLYGKIPAATKSVSVNDYILKSYRPGSQKFLYKISRENDNIHPGKNTYTLKLLQKNGEVLSENLTIYHTTNPEEMQKYQAEVTQKLLHEQNTPENIRQRELQKQQKIAKISQWEDGQYYTENWEPFTLRVAFMSEKQASQDIMSQTTEALKQLGISVEAMPIATKEMENIIKTGEKKYDLIIVGIRSPGTVWHMGEAFFSSSNNHPNFSNLSSKNFENMFLELQKISDNQKRQELQQKITDFMNEYSFFLPVSKPLKTLYVDRNLKGFSLPKTLGSIADLSKTFEKLSIKDFYQKNTTGKSIGGFFSWLFDAISDNKNVWTSK